MCFAIVCNNNTDGKDDTVECGSDESLHGCTTATITQVPVHEACASLLCRHTIQRSLLLSETKQKQGAIASSIAHDSTIKQSKKQFQLTFKQNTKLNATHNRTIVQGTLLCSEVVTTTPLNLVFAFAFALKKTKHWCISPMFCCTTQITMTHNKRESLHCHSLFDNHRSRSPLPRNVIQNHVLCLLQARNTMNQTIKIQTLCLPFGKALQH